MSANPSMRFEFVIITALTARLRPLWRVRARALAVLLAVLLSVALLGLGGCSALRFGYRQAPDLMYWYLDGYLDFNASQTPKVRESLAQWLAWHRRTQLPDYAHLLARAQAEVLVDTTPARVCEWQAELLERAHTAYDRAAPAAAEFVTTVTPPQIQYLERRYTKANAEFARDYLQSSPRKRVDAAVKRTVDHVETLYGALSSAQRQRLTDALAHSPFDAERWLAERRARQQEALQILRQFGLAAVPAIAHPPGAPAALAALHAYVGHIERSPHEPYRRYADQLREFNCALAAEFHNATSVAQRQVAALKLAGWETDLRVLAAGASPPAGLSGAASAAP